MRECRRPWISGISRPKDASTGRIKAELPSRAMRDYDAEYKDNTRQYAYDFDYRLREYMMDTFRPFLVNGRALEVGCYKGEFTKLILKQFPHVTVVEASRELIAYCRQQFGSEVDFIHSTVETADLTADYDSIFLMHTLEHLDDPVLVLARIKAWLSQRGRL